MASSRLIAGLVALLSLFPNESSSQLPQKDIVNYQDCGSKGRIEKIKVIPCVNEPCELPKGTRINVFFTGSFSKDSQKVMGRVSCQIDSLNLTLPGVAYDMCGKYANCPVKANEIFTANVEVPILKLYPSRTAHVALLIWGDDELEFCVKSDFTIVDPKPST